MSTLASLQFGHGEGSDPLRLLITAAAELLSAPQLDAVLAKTLEISRAVIGADAYAVWNSQGGEWRMLQSAGLSETYLREASVIRGASAQSKLDGPFIAEDVSDLPQLRDRLGLYKQEGIQALMAFPLHDSEQNVVGTVSFYFRHPRRFDAELIRTASSLATIAAAAISTAGLYEEQIRLRVDAEAERARWGFLAEATALLNLSLDYPTTLQSVADAAVPRIADWCSLVMVTADGGFEPAAVAHSDPSKLALGREMQRRYPPEKRPQSALHHVVQTQQELFVPVVNDEMLRAAAADEEHLRMMRELGMHSALVVPMIAGRKVVGVLTFVNAESHRQLNAEDRKLASILAARAAVAIENARLYQSVEEELRNRIRLQEALADTESRLRQAQVAGKIGAYVWEVATGKVTWAPEVPSLAGLVPSGDVNEWRALIHPEDHAAIDARTRNLTPNQEVELEYRIVKPDGSVVWLLTRGRRIHDRHGRQTHAVGIAMDITERKLSEAALQRAEKLAAAGRLAATVAHEINNPLEAVTNLLYLVRTDASIPAIAREYLHQADAELARVAHLTKQTLGFYRESASPLESVDISHLADEVVAIYGRRASAKEIKIARSYPPGIRATAVRGEVRQVLSNLLANAIDACERGGQVWISIRQTTVGPEAPWVRVSIADNGIGISKEHHTKVFEPFFTTKRDVGTGLGLWVCRQLVGKQNGRIRFRSATSGTCRGSIFQVSYPGE